MYNSTSGGLTGGIAAGAALAVTGYHLSLPIALLVAIALVATYMVRQQRLIDRDF